MPEKIISDFQQRRRLAQAIADLSQTEKEQDLLEAVREISRHYSSSLVLAALLKNLATPNSQIRGGLGHLATLLPQEDVLPALRRAAANRQLSAQNRITAALILDRFLGEPAPPAVLSDLNQTNEVALQSLREAVEEGRHNRHVLLEYVLQMRQTAPEIAFMVMDLMAQIAESDRAELYRLIALDDRLAVAEEALARLERLALSLDGPQALRALHTLQFTLPPHLVKRVERAVRKQRFAGNHLAIPMATDWHVFISPADTGGNQTLWFANSPASADPAGALMGVVINSRTGILQAFGHENASNEDVPKSVGIGQLVMVTADSGESIALLEAPFDFGRWRVQTALTAHWALKSPRPLPAEYRLYNDLIWQFGEPHVDPALSAFFTPDADQEVLTKSKEELDDLTTNLFSHPVMGGWVFHNRGYLKLIKSAEPPDRELPLDRFVALILRELEKRPEGERFSAAMAEGLRVQAAWLHIAGSPELAASARILATQVASLPTSENPVLVYMIQSSLRPAGRNDMTG